jgi:UDP-N-acetylmuramoyl-tripeptide--D-alanyl-D-alanine ligase
MMNLPSSPLLLVLIISIAVILFYVRRSLRYLQFFQQEEYNSSRFVNWWFEKRAFDTRGSLVALVVGGLGLAVAENSLATLGLCVVGGLVLIAASWTEEDPRKVGKIKLNMTDRLTAIYQLSIGLYAAVVVGILWLISSLGYGVAPILWLTSVTLIQSAPLWLMLANAILWPNESKKQQAFMAEAKEILADYDPYVIGITGSYGKTSTKAILGSLLEAIEPTFWTPGSINTEMGITRQVRENLKRQQRLAIIEMGAYQIGSVAKLCRLTPPDAGLVTAVGVMHLERFGGIENIYKAKCELPQAIDPNGLLVCNGDNPGARKMAGEYPKATTVLYGLEPELGHLDCWMSEIEATMDGTTFNLHWHNEIYAGFTKLLGVPMLSNLVGAFAMCCALGKNPEYVIAAIRSIEPANNRLNLRKNGDGFILDDSYNSNPIGFASALEVLEGLPGGRKILMTPGMVELGDLQAAENRQVALKAAEVCDLVIVVGDTNKQDLLTGLKEGGLSEDKILIFDNRDKALAHLMSKEFKQPADMILIENDLPDLYEAEVKF